MLSHKIHRLIDKAVLKKDYKAAHELYDATKRGKEHDLVSAGAIAILMKDPKAFASLTIHREVDKVLDGLNKIKRDFKGKS